VQSSYSKGQGTLELYLGNKTQTPLQNMRATVSQRKFVTLQFPPPPSLIAPMQQHKLVFNVKCETAFENVLPELSLSLQANKRERQLKIKLPIVFTKFVDPLPLDSATFMAQFQAINNPPLEIKEVFKALHAVNPVHVAQLFSQGFRFAVIQGVDTNPANIVCAGGFSSASGTAGCLIRLETNSNANMVRLTIKATKGEVASALRYIILAHMAEEIPASINAINHGANVLSSAPSNFGGSGAPSPLISTGGGLGFATSSPLLPRPVSISSTAGIPYSVNTPQPATTTTIYTTQSGASTSTLPTTISATNPFAQMLRTGSQNMGPPSPY